MSKERELLNLCAVTFKARHICPLLLAKISEFLAQPEQPEQTEPVAWMWEDKRIETNSWATVVSPAKPEKCGHVRNIRPLYTAPQKRERLTDEEVRVKYRDIALDNPLYVPSYYAGFRDAERTLGIGVDDETK